MAVYGRFGVAKRQQLVQLRFFHSKRRSAQQVRGFCFGPGPLIRRQTAAQRKPGGGHEWFGAKIGWYPFNADTRARGGHFFKKLPAGKFEIAHKKECVKLVKK